MFYTGFYIFIYINEIQSVSGCQNLIVCQTAGPISVKFGRKNPVGKIAIVLHPYPLSTGHGGLKNTKSLRK